MNARTGLRFGLSVLVLFAVVTAVEAQPSPTKSQAAASQSPNERASAAGGTLPTRTPPQTPDPTTKSQNAQGPDDGASAAGGKGADPTVALIGFVGVIVGGLVQGVAAYFIAKRKAETDQQAADRKAQADQLIAENKAKFDIAKSMVDWRLKQLSELYGPLRTLFAQSNAVYRTMNKVLEKANRDKFRLLNAEQLKGAEFLHITRKTDDDGFLFVTKREPAGAWEPFRTVLYIDDVYGLSYQVELYFDRIVEISTRLVAVIETKAGLALTEESGPSSSGGPEVKVEDTLRHKFGQYLAHAAVLQAIHGNRRAAYAMSISKRARSEAPPGSLRALYPKEVVENIDNQAIAINLATHESAAFPQDIQKLVGIAYDTLQLKVAQWEEKSREESKGKT